MITPQDDFWHTSMQLGQVGTTPMSLIIGLGMLVLIFILNKSLKKLLVRSVFPRFELEPGVAVSYATIVGYLFLVAGVFMVLPLTFSGISWHTFGVMLGAVSFGIGFGLRNIADNFVSGIIVLFERPICMGDYVEVSGYSGVVDKIKARCTIVRTNDNVNIIVPNSSFISDTVINWSHNDRKRRFRIPVGVHYSCDVFQVKEVLERSVVGMDSILASPAPEAKFVAFGESSLDFELWVWTESGTLRPQSFRSAVNYSIWKALKAANIEIPYPQRDLHLRSVTPDVLKSLKKEE